MQNFMHYNHIIWLKQPKNGIFMQNFIFLSQTPNIPKCVTQIHKIFDIIKI